MTKREAKGKMLEVVRKRGKGEAMLRKIKKAKKGESDKNDTTKGVKRHNHFYTF